MHPTVLWAQRVEHIWLTVDISNAQDVTVNMTQDSLHFSCTGDGKDYNFEIAFFAPIVESESKYLQHRLIDIVLKKAEAADWPRLTKGSQKLNWLKIDWNKWQDSDAEDENDGFDMGGMGGMPGMQGLAGMEGMAGMGGLPDFSQFTQGSDSDDDDDDELPNIPEDDKPK